jgi:dipeptidyl aminopeptidase/acylaminoacyl peptidase
VAVCIHHKIHTVPGILPYLRHHPTLNAMKKLLVLFCLGPIFAAAQLVPSFEQVLSLRAAGSPVISPDGHQVVFTITTTDWNDNRYDTEIWISRDGGKPVQLTNTAKGNSTNPSFSPDGQWIAFLADRGNKTQIHIMRADGGEARAVTKEEEPISAFEWHPSGNSFVFLKPEKEDKIRKEVEKRYGAFETDDKEFTLAQLWQIDFLPNQPDPTELPCYELVDSLRVKSGCLVWPKARKLTNGKFTVTGFIIAPDGSKVAYSHQPDPLINSSVNADISWVDLSSGKSTILVQQPGPDGIEDWSPDSQELLYTSSAGDTTSYFYLNNKLFSLRIADKSSRRLAADFDENIGGLRWTKTGIYFTAWNKTKRPIYRIDPSTGKPAVFLQAPEQILGFSLSKSGEHIAFAGRNGDQLNEIFVTSTTNAKPSPITRMTEQTANWKVAQSEVVTWKSKDGATVEGVLHKPKNYDPKKKYPLLVVIHGGPTGIDTPTPVPVYVYPIVQWLDKGCLVLRPNYRGSAGYGEKFRSLNVKNLGVGDAWDVLSGVDFLDKQGLIDKSKMGCMGWSQGGYISAFLTTTSDAFKAISVGAGISDWMTYYVSTDIHPFTRQYLKATPWSDEAMYRKTSPMTYINQARTPTLIQHGEFDRRVPIANAYQLLQGLRDKGVKSELVVYKGFGHGITKPKERLAATWHNWQWFNKYVWGEQVDLPVNTK